MSDGQVVPCQRTRRGLRFWLGTHQVSWLELLDVPLMVSHRRLGQRRRLPRARAPWALDSGGFTELSLHGRWTMDPLGYIEAVARYQREVRRLAWAAPMDWMCEPAMLAATGLSVREHQERTVANFLDLRGHGPFIPVAQGWTPADYERCVDLYRQAGIDLAAQPLVGVGSVCRRQGTREIAAVFATLADAGIRCHGFGVKTTGLAQYGHLLASADSMAWSYHARRRPPLPGCPHRSCSNCARYALAWRDRLLATDR